MHMHQKIIRGFYDGSKSIGSLIVELLLPIKSRKIMYSATAPMTQHVAVYVPAAAG